MPTSTSNISMLYLSRTRQQPRFSGISIPLCHHWLARGDIPGQRNVFPKYSQAIGKDGAHLSALQHSLIPVSKLEWELHQKFQEKLLKAAQWLGGATGQRRLAAAPTHSHPSLEQAGHPWLRADPRVHPLQHGRRLLPSSSPFQCCWCLH